MHFNLFVCGSGCFLQQIEDDDQLPFSSPTSQKTSIQTYCKTKTKKCNPFSNRGREKFSKVLADLEEERRKIYRQMGSDKMLLVRFCYKDGKWVPIVVKLHVQKENCNKPKQDDRQNSNKPKEIQGENNYCIDTKQVNSEITLSKEAWPNELERRRKRRRKRNRSWLSFGASYYWYIVLVLILLCLVMSGRSFAILCATVWWYLVSIVKGEGKGMERRRSMKKNSFVRKSSDKALNSDVKFQTMRSMERTPRR